VKEFDRIVNPNWHGETMAISESKAKNNLAYQYKKQNGKTARTKITLPAKVYLGG
jgi:hypothetical protein